MMKYFWLAILLLSSMILNGCETSKKIYMVISDPGVPVGYPENEASEVSFSILADKDINLNYSGEPTPFDIQLIYLNEESKILNVDYYQIATEPLDQLLSKNYIDHQDYTVEPGQFKILKPFKLNQNTQFIAVIAHYADADSSVVQWLDLIKVESTGQKYTLLIHVRSDEVEIKKT